MAYTNPGQLFLARRGTVESAEDVLSYADFLRQEARLPAEPPVDVARVYSRFEIPEPGRASLPNQQGLLVDPEKGLILINSDDPPTRQRFSEAHELMELLFSTLPRGRDRLGRQRAGPFREAAKERLCNEGAAELLMPSASFLPRVRIGGVSLNTARLLAAEYAVSTTAALVHMARRGPGRHAVVLWRMKNKPADVKRSVPVEQIALFPEPSPRVPAQRLRVEWALLAQGDAFIPPHKSVPEECSIWQAWREATFTIATEWLDLGPIKGVFVCENQPLAFEGERYVLSLLHMPGDADCGPSGCQ